MYRVSLRGNPESAAADDAAVGDVLVLGLLDDELLVQALAVARVRAAATAAVPHRTALVLFHFALAFMLRFTCSYLLIKEYCRCLYKPELGVHLMQWRQPPAASSSLTSLSPRSAMKRFPLPSTATE